MGITSRLIFLTRLSCHPTHSKFFLHRNPMNSRQSIDTIRCSVILKKIRRHTSPAIFEKTFGGIDKMIEQGQADRRLTDFLALHWMNTQKCSNVRKSRRATKEKIKNKVRRTGVVYERAPIRL